MPRLARLDAAGVSEYRRLEFERRRSIFFEGLKIDITSPEDLVISKLYWAKNSLSETQLRDVRNLLNTVCKKPMGTLFLTLQKTVIPK